MNDPWDEFESRAGRSEEAGFFERSLDDGRTGGVAAFYTAADRCLRVSASTDPRQLAEATGGFLGGHRRGAAFGYLGFDAVGLYEPLLRTFPSGSPFPLGEIALVDAPEIRPVPPRRRISPSRALRRELRPREDSLPRPRFESAVRRLRHAIVTGEAFQVVLAHRRTWPRPATLLEAARRLRRQERYGHFYYLRFGDREIVGATPESVLEIEGRRAFVDPIAGTIPRGGARGSRPPLRADPKELAEHRMLVDLARNDLGRVARTGSVRLLWTERRKRYARLEHLVSRVGAELAPRVGPWSALGAVFPAGTVSGAPKIRATELLRREEGTWRGPYGGAVGLLTRDSADWALAIRTAFAAEDSLYTAAGGGIVHRSEPRREWNETLTKLAQVESSLLQEGRR